MRKGNPRAKGEQERGEDDSLWGKKGKQKVLRRVLEVPMDWGKGQREIVVHRVNGGGGVEEMFKEQ